MLIFFYITLFLLLLYGLLIEYYRRAWNQIPVSPPLSGGQPTDPIFVTVIVPARNEEKNIANCLLSLTAQVYPENCFEIIVVNDHSTDQTASIVQHFKHPGILLISLEEELNGVAINSFKKKSLELAIGVARGEWIMTTDADCILPPHWIARMIAIYHNRQAAFIAAPVKIPAGSSFLSVFQTLDFISLQGITAASVQRKLHSMCNGANLGYQKKIFDEVGGFRGIDHIASGDDMFLMYKFATRYPDKIFFLKSQDAIAVTAPAESWKAFIQQRIRWASKTGQYEDRNITPILSFVFIVNAAILFFLLAAIWNPVNLFYFFLLWVIKAALEFSFVLSVARFFNQQRLIRYFFLMEPLHIIYTVVVGAFGKFGSYEWKGRKVK